VRLRLKMGTSSDDCWMSPDVVWRTACRTANGVL
jgi:hypothetical protein